LDFLIVLLPMDHDGVPQLHVYPAGLIAYLKKVEETRVEIIAANQRFQIQQQITKDLTYKFTYY